MFIENFKVESPNVKYTETEIQSVYSYETTELVHENRNNTYEWVVKPKTVKYEFKTQTNVPKLGYYNVLLLILIVYSKYFLFIFLLILLSICFLCWYCQGNACWVGWKQWFNPHWWCYCKPRVSFILIAIIFVILFLLLLSLIFVVMVKMKGNVSKKEKEPFSRIQRKWWYCIIHKCLFYLINKSHLIFIHKNKINHISFNLFN